MKVLHVIPSLASGDGGPSRALALMERALSDEGVIVESAATDHEGLAQRNGKACGVPLQENGVVRRYFPKSFDFYKPAPSFARWIDAHVRDYDVVHVHALFSYMPTTAARAARRAGVPHVIRPLGTLNYYGMQQHRPLLKSLSMRCIEGPLLRDAAAVHFTSLDEALQARGTGIEMREAIIPLAVDAQPQAHVSREQVGTDPRLLFLSRLDPKKNIEGLLDAFAAVLRDFPGARLAIAGDGEAAYAAALKARSSALHLENNVDWLGHVEGEAKTAAFAAADVFVLPSFSENFGIAAVEAMAAGLPVLLGEGVAVAADAVAAGAGFAVAPNAEAIADGLRRIIGSDARRMEMSVRARQLALDRYSMAAMGARLKQLYLDITSRPRP